MGLLAKTLTKDFRACYFRNQPVHQFYNHLQAVIKEISPDGELNHLFARPIFPGNSSVSAREVEWETELSGDAVKLNDLPEERRSEVVGLLTTYIQKIRNYAEAKEGRTGKEKDYSDYLKAVAVSPDASQIFVVSGKPVLVHWGYFSEGGKFTGQVKYAGWDEFLAEIQRKAPPEKKEPVTPTSAAAAAAAATLFKTEEPAAEKQSIAAKPVVKEAEPAVVPEKTEKKANASAKEVEKDEEKPAAPLEEDELNKSKPLIACGLGAYEWVKWLAIILAIIILLLLFLPKRQSALPPAGMMGGGSGGAMMGGGGGGPGGGGAAGGGNGGGAADGSSGQPGICPHCGHQIPQSAPAGSTQPTQPQPAGQPAVNDQSAQSQPAAQPADGQPIQSQSAPQSPQTGEKAPTSSGSQ